MSITKPKRVSPTVDLISKRSMRSGDKSPPIIHADAMPTLDNWLPLLLDETLERSQPLWRAPRRYFRGSGAGNECIRALTFEAMGHNVPHEARVSRIFSTGNAIESVNVAAAKAAKVFVEGSDQLEGKIKDPPIICHVDLIVKHPSSGQRFLGEIKSIKQENFKKLPKEHGPMSARESPLLKSHPGYVMQWNTYSFTPEVDLEYGFILFECKNTQHQKIYWLTRDKALHEQVLQRRREALPYVEANPQMVAPIPEGLDPVIGKGPCRWCPHRYLCKRVSDEETEYDNVRAIDAKLRG